MKPHKHAALIKAWADGVRIEEQYNQDWMYTDYPDWESNRPKRIAPIQPPDEDGWRPWFGGENPAPGKDVEYKCGQNPTIYRLPSNDLRWKRIGNNGDIIAWREVPEVKQKVKKVYYLWAIERYGLLDPIYPMLPEGQKPMGWGEKQLVRLDWSRTEIEE